MSVENVKNGVNTNKSTFFNVRYMAVTAMLSAVSFILMFLDFWIPLVPPFIKMDFSELPALIGSFAMGPVCGIIVCLIKNLLHLLITTTGGVGELSNFILGVAFVLPAGLLYKRKRGKKSAITGSVIGAILMAAISVASNYFIVYPFYSLIMPIEQIISMYQEIVPSVNGLLECLLIFNMPFTFVKGLFSVIITFSIYKHISPILKGTNHRSR